MEMQAYICITPLATSTLSQVPWDDINTNPGKLSPASKEQAWEVQPSCTEQHK